MSTTTQIIHQATGAERLFGIDFRIDEAWTKHATNYWTFELFLRRLGDEIGLRLGNPLELQLRSIAARKDILVFTQGDAGLLMAAGDIIYCKTTRTGTPAALVAPGLLPEWASVSS